MEIMLDVKKLIVGFLILALGASMSAWILSGATNNSSVVSVAQNPAAQPLTNNAFTETTSSVPDDVAALLEGQLPSSTEAALNDPNNLTAALGNSMLDGLISANPDGIQTDSDGNGEISQPDDQAILAELSGNQAAQNLSVPNWDAEVVADQAKIRTSPTSSYQSMADYLNSFSDINNKYFVQSGLQQIADDASTTDPSDLVVDPTVITTANSMIPLALVGAMQLKVPAPFAAFQKSWIKLLVYEKNTAASLNIISTDPARAVLTFSLEQNNYDAAIAEFSTTFQKVLKEENLSVGSSNGIEKDGLAVFVNNINIFSIKTAQAVGVGVPVYDPVVQAAVHAGTASQSSVGWGTFFKNLAIDIGLQILKNTLIAQLQSHVIKWIQGSGAPMFVQNWADDFANAAIMSATNYINSNFACIGTTQLPHIQLIMNAIYKPGNNVCAAQFASNLSQANLTSFLNNFQNGGFLTFSQTLMPSNDFYGGLFFTAQGAGQAAKQSQSLFSVKTTAQQGFKGVEICADGSNPNGAHSVAFVGPLAPGESAPPPTTVANNGLCNNGQPPTTQSPGQSTGMMLNQSLGTAPKLIAGATTIDGIINAFTISLINALASTLVTTASGAINGEINTLSTVNTSALDAAGAATTAASSSLSTTLSCTPASQSISQDSEAVLFALGGTYGTSGNEPNYTWTSSDGQVGAGEEFDIICNDPNACTITLSDDAGDSSATCLVTLTSVAVAAAPATTTTSTTP